MSRLFLRLVDVASDVSEPDVSESNQPEKKGHRALGGPPLKPRKKTFSIFVCFELVKTCNIKEGFDSGLAHFWT